MRAVGISVYGPIIAGTVVRLDGIGVKPLNDANYCAFNVPNSWTDSHLFINANGYQPYSRHLDLKPGLDTDFILSNDHPDGTDVGSPTHPIVYITNLTPQALPRLHVEGLRFVTEQGQPWRMAFADSFRLYERYLRNEDISPVLSELKSLKANGVRVLGSFDFGTPQSQRLYPSEHPDYFQRLPAFFAVLQGYNLYAEWCAFADTQRSVPGAANQTQFWNQTCDVLRPITNVLLQRVNEGNQHENGVDGQTEKPAGVLSSFGSNGTGDDPPLPFWDFCDLGSERRGDFALSATTVNFAIKGYVGEGAGGGFVGTHRATVVSEPPGFADAPIEGRRTNSPVIAYQLGVGAAAWGAGGTAHSDCGVQSVMLTAIQRVCVSEFLRGIWAV